MTNQNGRDDDTNALRWIAAEIRELPKRWLRHPDLCREGAPLLAEALDRGAFASVEFTNFRELVASGRRADELDPRRRWPLGSYFEAAWDWFAEHHPDADLLAAALESVKGDEWPGWDAANLRGAAYGGAPARAACELVALAVEREATALLTSHADAAGNEAASVQDLAPPDHAVRDTEFKQYFTLDQVAAFAGRVKRTLQKWPDRPEPDVKGGGGKPDEWRWATIRPWLEEHSGRLLPERPPVSPPWQQS